MWGLPTITRLFEPIYPQKSPQSSLLMKYPIPEWPIPLAGCNASPPIQRDCEKDMSSKATIELGSELQTKALFTYPNDGHADQTLQETVEHYLHDSLQREGLNTSKVSAQISAQRCAIEIDVDDQNVAKEIESRYQAFFDTGKTGQRLAEAFQESGKWDNNWKFLLPLGLSLAFAKAVEIMDFPPLTLISNQDYLKSKTTSRWWELLILNGVSEQEKARYSCILDIVPVAAPASDGQKLKLSGIYDGPFDDYDLPMLQLLTRTQNSALRPLIALGLPIREWLLRLWKLSLKVLDIGSINLSNGATCNVIATNHPSFFYYAVHSNKGPGSAEKNLAAGLAVMKQDVVCAAWHAEMGRDPAADPKVVFTMSDEKWKGKDAELLELVKKQAGIPKLFGAEAAFVESIKSQMPSAEELEELERKFYEQNAEVPQEQDPPPTKDKDSAK